jgi:hypothetical protein
MFGMQQLADADAGDAADFVLVTRADAAAGGANGLLGAGFVDALFFLMVREDDVGVVAEDEIVADGDADLAEVGDLLEEARRVDHDAVADHRPDAGPQDAGGE